MQKLLFTCIYILSLLFNYTQGLNDTSYSAEQFTTLSSPLLFEQELPIRYPHGKSFQTIHDELDEYLYEHDLDLLEDEEIKLLKRIRFFGETYNDTTDMEVIRYLFTRDKDTKELVISHHLKLRDFRNNNQFPEHIILTKSRFNQAQQNTQKNSDTFAITKLGSGYNRYAYSVYYTNELIPQGAPSFYIKVAKENTLVGTRDEFELYNILVHYYPNAKTLPFSKIYDARRIGTRWCQSGEYIQGQDLQKINTMLIKKSDTTGLTQEDIGYLKLLAFELGRTTGSLFAQTETLWGDYKPANVVVVDNDALRTGDFLIKNIDYEMLHSTNEQQRKALIKNSPRKKNIPKRFNGITLTDAYPYRSHIMLTPWTFFIDPFNEVLAKHNIPSSLIINLFFAGFLLECQKKPEASELLQSILKIDFSENFLSIISTLQKHHANIDMDNLESFLANPTQDLFDSSMFILMNEYTQLENNMEHGLDDIQGYSEEIKTEKAMYQDLTGNALKIAETFAFAA